jgi:peptide/nickel transport system substrate-binding protein
MSRVALVIAVCAALLASACTRVEQSHSGARNAWTVPGTLRIATRQDPENLNSLLGTQDVDEAIAAFWGAFLFRWNDRNELVPELAAIVPTVANGGISADGLTITYHLRAGVKWQDGAPFTSRDVIFTWKAIMNPRNPVVSRHTYDVVAAIERRDDTTFVVHLKRRFAPFVVQFFGPSNPPSIVLPEHLLGRLPDFNHADYNNLPIGTGPFRIVSYEKGQRLVMVANGGYWRGPPKLRRIEFLFVANDNTLLTMLETHRIDFYFRASETLIASLRGIAGTRVVLTPRDRFTDVGLNAGNPALGDVRVRRALAYAIDRNALIDKVMHGVAVVGWSNHAALSNVFAPDAARYPYDPARANALLDEARIARPLHLTLVSFTGSATIAATEELIQQQWAKVGVDAAIKNFPSGELYATLAMGGIEQSGKFDAAIENWSNGADPDDSVLLMCSMAPPAGWNIYHFCNPELDAAERAALESNDPQQRRAAYATIQRIVADRLPFIVLWYEVQIDVINSDLRGYRPSHSITPFWNVWEWSI